MYIGDKIGIEMYYNDTQATEWLGLQGNVIPPEEVENLTYKYHLPPEKDQALLGNYWWVVRLRPPVGGKKKYEYMYNRDYSCSRMVRDFAQCKNLSLSTSRWYHEGPIERTLASCLYPYCPGLNIDFRRCNINLGLNNLQYMEETKEPPRDLQCLSPIRR
jgi:hypothetical protein